MRESREWVGRVSRSCVPGGSCIGREGECAHDLMALHQTGLDRLRLPHLWHT